MVPVSNWIADPDIISSAIRLLVWVSGVIGAIMTIMGTALVGTLLYIWRRASVKVDSIDRKVDRIASGLEMLTLETKVEIRNINTRCDERHTTRRATDRGKTFYIRKIRKKEQP